MTFHFAPIHSFIRWLAANPGYVICATLRGRHGDFSVLMERIEE